MKTTSDELLAFVTVADQGSLTATARLLSQTPSGISRTLGRLEQKLGTTLLTRTTRRLSLTEEGKIFLSHARDILAGMEAAEEALFHHQSHPAGPLRIDAASPFMLHVLVPLIPAFRERYPDITLTLNSNDQIIDLIERRTDIAIRIGALQDSTLHASPLGRSRLRILASPAYLQKQGTPQDVSDLAQHQLLGFTHNEKLNTWPLYQLEGEGYRIRPSLTASSGETLRQLALAGVGIVCLADFMCAQDVTEGRLCPLLPEALIETYQPIHAVYYRNSQLAARIRCFIDFWDEINHSTITPRNLSSV